MYFFWKKCFYFQNGVSLRLLRVGGTSAPQFRCIFSWWIHFRSIYECLGTLSIDLSGWKSSHTHYVMENFWKYRWFPLIFIEFHWFSLIFHRFPLNFIDFHWFSIDFHWITANLRSTLETLWSCNRPIEYSNTRKSIGNGFPMKKYVGVVVWKSFQLVIAAEIYHFENRSIFSKKVHFIIINIWIIKKQDYMKNSMQCIYGNYNVIFIQM